MRDYGIASTVIARVFKGVSIDMGRYEKACAITLNQRVVGSNPTSPTIVPNPMN